MTHSPVSSLSIKSASTVSLQTLRPPSITILSRDVDCKPCAGRQRPNLRRTCLKCEQFFRSQTDLFFHLRTYRGTSQPLGAQSNNTKRLGDHHRPTYQALLSPTRDPGLHRRLPPCLPRLDRVFCLSCTFFGSIIPYSKHTRLYQAALSALHTRELRVRKPEPEGQWDEFRRILQKDSKAPCTPRYIRRHRLNADMRSSCLHTSDSPSSAATGASSSSRRDTSYTI